MATVHGAAAATIKIKGKEYVTVAERCRLAHEATSYQIISEDVFNIGDRWFIRVGIRVAGNNYMGTSELRFNAEPDSADGKAPMECAETSAVGRALGFAGFGAIDSIASAEELRR